METHSVFSLIVNKEHNGDTLCSILYYTPSSSGAPPPPIRDTSPFCLLKKSLQGLKMPAQDINTDRLLVACVISVGSITSFSEDVRSMVMVKGQWNRSGDDIPW